jgi:hypothetical protein
MVHVDEAGVCYLRSFSCSFQKKVIQVARIRHYLLITDLQKCRLRQVLHEIDYAKEKILSNCNIKLIDSLWMW